MRKYFGNVFAWLGGLSSVFLFWGAVLDGPVGSWQGRAVWVAWLVVSVLLAIVGGALLVRDSEEK